MDTIKLNELATSAITLSDFIAKADANGVMTKNSIAGLSAFFETVGEVGFKGKLLIADTPTEDGWWFASESGTFTNAGGLIVDLTENLVIIVRQTTFSKIDIPLNITVATEISENNTDFVPSGLAWEEQQRVNDSLNNIKWSLSSYFNPSNTEIVAGKQVGDAVKSISVSFLDDYFIPFNNDRTNVKHIRFGFTFYKANDYIQISTYYGDGDGGEISITGNSSRFDISSWVADDLLGVKKITLSTTDFEIDYYIYMPQFIALFGVSGLSLNISNSQLSNDVLIKALQQRDRLSISNQFPDHAKYLNNASTQNIMPELYQALSWNFKTPKLAIPLANDFHGQVECIRDLVNWIKNDKAIDSAVKFITISGDYLTAGEVLTKENLTDKIDEIFYYLEKLGKPVLFAQGNHDEGWENVYDSARLIHKISKAEIRELVYDRAYNLMSTAEKSNFHFGSALNACYYYYDMNYSSKDFRIIAIDDYELPEIVNSSGVYKYSATSGAGVDFPFSTYLSQAQFQFLIDTLENTPDTTNVIAMRHTHWDDGDNALSGTTIALQQVIKAYNDRTSGTISVDALEGLSAFTINYDFSSKTESHCMCFNGHKHYHTLTPNNTNLGGIHLTSTCLGTSGSFARLIGSVSEANCDVLTVNTTNNQVQTLRYGIARPLENFLDENGHHLTDAVDGDIFL